MRSSITCMPKAVRQQYSDHVVNCEASMFFSRVLSPGKKISVMPHADGFPLHLSQASIPADVAAGTRVSVLIGSDRLQQVVLCTLCAGRQDSVMLDQFLTE